MDFVAGTSREMVWKDPQRVSGIRASGFPLRLTAFAATRRAKALFIKVGPDEIRRKASLAMDRHRLDPFCLTFSDNPHG
jgi:hypothetical protein